LDYETEEQQVEALKKWWSENAMSVIAGVAIGALAIFGWVGWGKYQVSQARQASDGFTRTLDALQDGSGSDAAVASATELRDEHGNTLYAVMASMAAGKALAESGDFDGAAKELKWAAKNSDSDEIRTLAKIRLARVLGAAGSVDEALGELPAKPAKRFTGLIAEVRGDLHLLKGDKDKAREAYQQAVDSGERVADNRLLTMKLNDLAVATDEPG